MKELSQRPTLGLPPINRTPRTGNGASMIDPPLFDHALEPQQLKPTCLEEKNVGI
jgi:hypothetical protein